MVIALGSDHVGIELKEKVMAYFDSKGIAYKDLGTYSRERTDYPIYGKKVAQAVVSGEYEKGIIFCGTGVGISIAANKVQDARCVCCSDCYSAKLSRLHNDTNLLALGSRVVGTDLALMIIDEWLAAQPEGGRHQRRIDMLNGSIPTPQ